MREEHYSFHIQSLGVQFRVIMSECVRLLWKRDKDLFHTLTGIPQGGIPVYTLDCHGDDILLLLSQAPCSETTFPGTESNIAQE
jgi:hypothetical protein